MLSTSRSTLFVIAVFCTVTTYVKGKTERYRLRCKMSIYIIRRPSAQMLVSPPLYYVENLGGGGALKWAK